MGFLVRALPEVRNQFSNKVLYNNCSKFFLELFGQYLNKSKNGLPIVFSKCDLAWGGGAKLINKQISEKAKDPQICPSFGDNMGKT